MRWLAALLVALFALLPPLAEAQQQIPVMPPNTVWGRIGQNQIGPGGAIPFQTLANTIAPLIVPPAGFSVRSVSTSVSLGSTDCGNIIIASGGFTTVTLGAATGFTNPCWIRVVNTDGGAGKHLAVNGLTNGGFGWNGCGNGNICPGQAVDYVGNGLAWTVLRDPGPWRTIDGAPQLYVATTGNDSNDCLSAATPCTLATTCIGREVIGSANYLGSTVHINVAAGLYQGSNGATLCQITGNAGVSASGLTFITGAAAGTVIFDVPNGGVGVFTKDLGETEITNISFIGEGGGAVGISGAQFSVVDVLTGNAFGNMGTNGISIQFTQSASLNLDGTAHVQNVSNNCPNHIALIALASNANVTVEPGVSLIFDCAASFNEVFSDQGGFWNIGSLSFGGAGLAGTVATKMSHFAATNGTVASGCVYTAGKSLATLGVPGNIDQAFPIGSCTDFGVATTASHLPTCAAAIAGQSYEVTDSAAAPAWGSTYSATGAATVTVTCNGTNFTVTAK